jgi:hypothetical protein
MVALSSTEAEYMALSAIIQDGLWLRTSLTQAHIPFQPSSRVCVDKEGAISLATNSSQHSWSKHIDIHYHFIQGHVEDGTFKIE